jgi:hypothetical protein
MRANPYMLLWLSAKKFVVQTLRIVVCNAVAIKWVSILLKCTTLDNQCSTAICSNEVSCILRWAWDVVVGLRCKDRVT